MLAAYNNNDTCGGGCLGGLNPGGGCLVSFEFGIMIIKVPLPVVAINFRLVRLNLVKQEETNANALCLKEISLTK
jgi:hypothetical protein